jgi:signal transduction histidine kinase
VKALVAVFGASRSLQRRLVVNVVIALLVCVSLAALVFVFEFYEHLDESAEADLRREALEVAAALDPAAPHLGQDPNAIRFAGAAGAYRYTVFDSAWTPILGDEFDGPPAAATIAALVSAETGAVAVSADRIGVAVRHALPEGVVFVLATTTSASASRSELTNLRHELEEQAGWVAFGVLSVLIAAILAARRSLQPLREALVQAAAVSPGAPERRLSSKGLPIELQPLIEAVNRAFDRLESGYQGQRNFSSNVAHEIRTPLAVLRSGIEALDDDLLRRELSEDLRRLDRMFEQLIDLARAESHGARPQGDVDLHRLTMDLALEMATDALRSGRSLAVVGDANAPARGDRGLLTVALRNLVRNALIHTPEGTEVEIVVDASPPGWRVLDRGPGVPDADKTKIFERFQRGVKNTGEGAGIGLAIVKTVVEAHGGSVRVEDRPGGGAAFSISLIRPDV